jgi:hypothetical protein
MGSLRPVTLARVPGSVVIGTITPPDELQTMEVFYEPEIAGSFPGPRERYTARSNDVWNVAERD